MIAAAAIPDLPEIRPGDDLAELLRPHVGDGDVLVVAHKIVSKAEGNLIALADVVPTAEAETLAGEHGKDPRHVQVILEQSTEIVRSRPSTLICRTRHGFVCANAGVDASNAPDGHVVVLPADPDRSARQLRAGLGVRCAVIVADSFGRAWRIAQVDIAIGVAGLTVVDDWAGRPDRDGRQLRASAIAIADEVAAAADLARGGKDAGQPAIVVRGLERWISDADGPGAQALIRARAEDLFA